MNNRSEANRLIDETSPYLLQHAYNPVDWHPWNEKTLAKAKREGKMLIVSVGYAACHWCHVMEHESFEDSTVAAVMNENFIPIKVDREERPDVDDIYMSAANLVSGRGGWPLNAFALPDGRPVWAGTYFPKEQWMEVLQQFADLQESDPERLERSADQLTQGIQSLDEIIVKPPSDYEDEDVSSITTIFLDQIDKTEGGQKGAPKFPMPNNYEFLLKYGKLYDDNIAMEALTTTLDKMAMGGIYDQVGGGFARYSVDAIWKVPHFEKMLYDNAQLISLYSDAYRATNDPLYKRVVEQSLEFIQREMSSSEGGFYSSLDADSEGEEGKFYIWSNQEINDVISSDDLRLLQKYYSTTEEGNWEHGNNILHITTAIPQIAKEENMSVGELWQKVDTWNELLLERRNERVRPGLDDKILTSWNALMIKAYVDAFKALGKREYLDIAIENAHFILKNQMSDDGRLNRNYKNGVSSINGFLDDYALIAEAHLALYEVTFDESWLEVNDLLLSHVQEHFYNEEAKMFYYTSDLDPPLVARKMEIADNVISGSNSIIARVFGRMGEIMYKKEYTEISEQMLANVIETIKQSESPSFYSNWLQLLLEMVRPSYEVAIVGPDAIRINHEMQQKYSPNAFYLGSDAEGSLPLLENKFVPGTTRIYVCQNKSCKLPVTDIKEAVALME